MGLKATSGGGGEIVQVQGGHIIRATGRKDRHSKVFTAKGPRDRRVRLAAHTAIQFYDVQDRLGYDRPSKAVDWLINKAKASIDKLAELPPWDPIASHNNNTNNNNHDDIGGVSNQMCLGGDATDNNSGSSSQFYAPHCLDSQSLGGSMKSFFPTNDTSHENNSDNNNNNNNNALDFQNYPHELISRGTHHNHQDLCLSLHSLNDPGGGGGASAHQAHPGQDQALFHGGFDSGWAQHQDVGRFTRLMGWVGDSGGGSSVGGEGRGGILFNTNPPSFMSTQALLMNQQGSTMPIYSHHNQRGTLQSSYSSLTRVFEDNPANNHSNNTHHDQSMSGIGHGSDSLMGFYIPSQIHADLHATGASISNRASSSSLSTESTQQ